MLINTEGKLFDFPGGDVFYDEKEKIVFFLRNYETEPYAEYAAYDLKTNHKIIHLKDSQKHHAFSDQLYYKILKGDKKYYALSTNKNKGGAVEIDLINKKVTRSTYLKVSKMPLIPLLSY